MTEDIFNRIQITGFDDDREAYRNIIKAVITAIVDIMNKKAVPYDLEDLNNRIETLMVIRRDEETHEYVSDNKLYLSKCNSEGKQYSDEEMIIFLTHELMHFISASNGLTDTKYYGYDEFFTEYITFMVISKIGGINMETYFKKNIKGYFGTGEDIDIIKFLSSKIGFEKLLSLYSNGNDDELEHVVGKTILLSINKYFDYYEKFVECSGKSIREANKMLELPSFSSHKKVIEENHNEIVKNIESYEIPKIIQ